MGLMKLIGSIISHGSFFYAGVYVAQTYEIPKVPDPYELKDLALKWLTETQKKLEDHKKDK